MDETWSGLKLVIRKEKIPVLLSQGIPVLPPGNQLRGLKLTSSETLPSGILMLNYTIPHA